jgi:hypothetical protein
MNAVKILAFVAMVMCASQVQALCPGQETDVVFFNGVGTPKVAATKHMRTLRDTVWASGVDIGCIHFELSHTQDNGMATDLIEAAIQKSTEAGAGLAQTVRMLLRAASPSDWFLAGVIDAVYNRNVGEVNDQQLNAHLAKVREVALSKGHRLVVVTHSQGGPYGNALWHRLTGIEQDNTRLVTVVTPAADVADGGPNTRLTQDAIAGLFFPVALAANVTNDEPCAGGLTDRWTCHGFDTAYLFGTRSREKIVNDVLDALAPAVQVSYLDGVVTYLADGSTVSGAIITLMYPNGLELSMQSAANGAYRYGATGAVPICAGCTLYAQKGYNCAQVDDLSLAAGITQHVSLVLDVCFAPN